nr:probable protein phosphatase 2C 25 [Ipomoea batatas]
MNIVDEVEKRGDDNTEEAVKWGYLNTDSEFLKQDLRGAEPETRMLPLTPELEFLILASDGLWDKVSNQDAVDAVRPLCTGSEKPQLLSACRKLVDLLVSRGSFDDVSVMLVQLRNFQLYGLCI